MTSHRGTREYAERFVEEDAPLQAARQRAAEVGCSPIGSGGGAALRLIAAAVQAKNVVELGTGTGVSGLWLLRGMQPDGVLTSVDTEPEHQRLARLTFEEAGFASTRFRLIAGRALEVLPRLTDSAYDVVFVDAVKSEYPEYLEAGLRLLRPGGIIAFDNALWHDRVADPAVGDAETESVRSLGRLVLERGDVVPALLPVGDGLLVAVKTAAAWAG
ncbi:MAG TPA: O-methyltransferase [Mycobacteriales bacterium]|nr:O-methyltransferase [Mycobacteriales bacterium]